MILPEFDVCMETEQNNPHHCYNVGEHILKSMQKISPDKVLRLAMLFHDIGKPETITMDDQGICHFHGHQAVSEEITLKILKRLKFDNYTIGMVTKLVRYHDYKVEAKEKNVRRAVMKIGEDIFPLLFQIKEADLEAQSTYLQEEKKEKLKAVQRVYEQVAAKGQCVSLKTLAVTGKDLISEAGMLSGPEIGKVLHQLLDIVIEDPEQNERENLLKLARQIK